MVKFSRTLFIMYFSGRCFSLWMKLIMYSHIGERWMRYTYRPFSNLEEQTGVNTTVLKWIQCQYMKFGVFNVFPSTKCNCLFATHFGYSVSSFSTTCLPKEQTLVEHWSVMFSLLS